MPKFSVIKPLTHGSFTDEQSLAVNTDGGRILLSASAGSGKTSVLTGRVVRKVLDGVPILNMLIVTFTKAAAAEMRQRIAKALQAEKDATNDLSLRRYLTRQIMALSQANICTMDAFYNKFVRQHFQRLAIAPDFRIVMGPEWELMRMSTMRSLFEKLYDEGDPDFLACVEGFSSEKSDENFFNVMMELVIPLESEPYPREKLDEICEHYTVKKLTDSKWYQRRLRVVADTLNEVLPLFEHAADYAQGLREVVKDNVIDQRLEDLAYVKELYAQVEQGVMPAVAFPKLQAPTRVQKAYPAYQPIAAEVKTARDMVKKAFAFSIPSQKEFEWQQSLCLTLAQGMRSVMLRYYDELDAVKRRKNVLSLSDTARLTLSLLVDSYDAKTDSIVISDFAKAYVQGETGSCLDAVFIDEYQDTNLLQNIIFRALSDDGKKLFCVGDLKQSIYRFRHARPDLFEGELNRFSKNGFPQVQFLTRNFRSSKGVLGFVNFFFARVMSKLSGGADYDETQWSYVGGDFPKDDYTTELLLCDELDEGWGELEAEDDFSDDYRQGLICAARIKEMMAQGQTVWNAKTKTHTPMSYDDVVILLRTVKGRADGIVRALVDSGIPAYSAKAPSYFDRYEVKFVLSFLRAIDNPYMDIPLAAALRSPIFGFTAQELCDLREGGEGCLYECLAQSREEKAKQALAVIERYRARAGVEPVYRLIWDLYGEFSLFAVVGAMNAPESRQENLRTIYRHAREYENSSLRGLYGFLGYMERVEVQLRNAEGANPAPAAPHVTVSTIHGYKGLEKPFVFVANMNRPIVGMGNNYSLTDFSEEYGLGLRVRDKKRRLVFNSFARSVIKDVSKEEEFEEALRLLYVAFTRAKQKLFLVGTEKIIAPESGAQSPVAAMLQKGLVLKGGRQIGGRSIKSLSSPLELVLVALMSHPAGLDFAEKIGVELPEGTLPDEQLLERSCLVSPQGSANGIPDVAIRIVKPIAVTKKTENNFVAVDMEQLSSVLDYEYDSSLGHIPAKVSVSDLKGLRDMDEDAGLMLARQIDYHKPAFLQVGLSAAQKGTAMHKFMQYMPFDRTPLSRVLSQLVHRGTLSEAEAEVLDLSAIEQFRHSELAGRIAASSFVEREYRFLSQVSADRYDPDLTEGGGMLLLQGVIDLFFEEEEGIVLVDYKTDRSDDPEYYKEKYQLQLQLYAKALEKLLKKPVFRRVIYAFSCQKEIDV